MAERDRFELDLATFLRDYAEDAPTEVRPAELARHFADAYPHGRGVTGRWSLRPSPALAWNLLLIGLVLALVAGTLAVGSRFLESIEPLPEQLPAMPEGMVAEEVDPGVFRVVNDGVRDLSSTDAVNVVAGYDGGIWLLGEQGFLRLGRDGSHEWPKGAGPESHVLQVAPDGTLWVIPTRRVFSTVTGSWRWPGEVLHSTDGEAWWSQPCPGDHCQGATVAPDGTLWASSYDGSACERGDAEDCEWWVGYLSPMGWQRLDGSTPADLVFGRLIFTDAGDLYGVSFSWDQLFYHYQDGVWRQDVYAELVDVGPDGTVWEHHGIVWSDPSIDEDLARYAGGAWKGWASADLPGVKYGLGLDQQFKVAPDGSLWFSMWRNDPGTDTGPAWGDAYVEPDWVDVWCDGLARFDGEAFDRFLRGQCISMDIAADGSVWVVAGEDDVGRDIYVVTPGAVSR